MNLLLVGLGNPDNQYQKNRHNAGFQFLDWLAKSRTNDELRKTNFQYDKYTRSEIMTVFLTANSYKLKAILAKPQTFMNQSGSAVKSCVARYTLHVTHDLIVVHDDLDMRLGSFKIQKGVGPKIHNGIDSIEKSLKTKDFWRIRIGIDNRDSDHRIPGEPYVLSDFTEEEMVILNQIFPTIQKRLICIAS